MGHLISCLFFFYSSIAKTGNQVISSFALLIPLFFLFLNCKNWKLGYITSFFLSLSLFFHISHSKTLFPIKLLKKRKGKKITISISFYFTYFPQRHKILSQSSFFVTHISVYDKNAKPIFFFTIFHTYFRMNFLSYLYFSKFFIRIKGKKISKLSIIPKKKKNTFKMNLYS